MVKEPTLMKHEAVPHSPSQGLRPFFLIALHRTTNDEGQALMLYALIPLLPLAAFLILGWPVIRLRTAPTLSQFRRSRCRSSCRWRHF